MPIRRYTTVMDCGCIVKTVDHNIVAWDLKCLPHKSMFRCAIASHDQIIEDAVLGVAVDPKA